MNNCLADLSRLIPAEYLKKGRGRVEKTEIIEMAIRHMKHLQGLRQGTNQINGNKKIPKYTKLPITERNCAWPSNFFFLLTRILIEN